MAKFLFTLSRGLEDPTRAVRTFMFAKFALNAGDDVSIFLLDDAVVYARHGMADTIKAPTGDELKPYLEELVEAGVPIHVCTPCANYRMVEEGEFVKTARLSTGSTLIELAREAKVMSF